MPMIALILLAALCGLFVVGLAKGGMLLLFAASTLLFLVLFISALVAWKVWVE